jgi:Domain of unknown function (DUF4349)
MRRADDDLIDPEIAAELEAIDATLAGEPVAPRHAEVAELTLLLVATRPEPQAEFVSSLDARVHSRFARVDEAEPKGARADFRRWFGPVAGLAATLAAVAVVVLALNSGGSQVALKAATSPAASSSSAGAASTSAASGVPHRNAKPAIPLAPDKQATYGAAASTATSSAAVPNSGKVIAAPLPNGRKIVQSSQLALSAPASHIDDVAQEVFRVIGDENGVVNSSTVTASASGYAQFRLSVPSSALQATMTSLSELKYASVSSRTDATQDVNGQYLSDQRQLADDRALRTSLLKQLANATTQAQIDSLNAQIRDAEASIRRDESTLNGLNHRINFSQIAVTVNTASPVPVAHKSTGSFTLGKAAHDAGRVLTVAAGVALIALAALLPIALIVALIWWIWSALRRRRREQALDLA